MNRLTVVIILTLLILPAILLAAGGRDQNQSPKVTIAVMNLAANNCPQPLAKAVSEMLASKLFEFSRFKLVERSQVNHILTEKGLHKEKCIDAACAAKLGKLLLVQKMVVGSISKINEYKLTIRVIHVNDSSVEFSDIVSVGEESQFEAAMARLARKIDDYYAGKTIKKKPAGLFDLSLHGAVAYAVGDLANGVDYGYGANLQVTMPWPLGHEAPVGLKIGFYSFHSTIDSIKSMYLMPVEVTFAHIWTLGENVQFIPGIGAGYLFSSVKSDAIEDRQLSAYSYATGFFYNPLVSLRTELHLLLVSGWYLVLQQEYHLFFEHNRRGQFFSCDLGLRALF